MRITREYIATEILETIEKVKEKIITPRQGEVIFKGLKTALDWLEQFEENAEQTYKTDKITIEIITKEQNGGKD